MLVLSEDGGWVVPQRAVWIPAGVTHQVRMLGSARAAPIEPGAARGRAGLRSGGGVAAVAPAAAGGRGHAGAVRQGRARRRAGPLLLHEVDRAPALPAHPAAARRGWGVVPGLHGGAGHPLAAAGLGRAAAHEPRSFSRHFREHRHVLRPMASARLRGAGAGAAGGGRSRHRHRAGFRLPGPGRVLNDVQARAGRGALRLPAHRLDPP